MEEKKYTVYVHKVNTEEGPLYYTGVTTNLKKRWKPSGYKGANSLGPYIAQYGWDNIEHLVVYETFDRDKAYKIEDQLICFYASIVRCINKHRSGHIAISDKNAYWRYLYANNDAFSEHKRKYEKQRMRNKRETDTEWVEQQRQYNRDWRSTTEGKIYSRVHDFNRYHPDHITESPLEARDNYRKYHIIPQYIKHDDLE